MNQDFMYQPDKLAEMYLMTNYAWDPLEGSPPEQYRDIKQAEWTMKW